jgi:hypothetical protein
MIAALHWVSYAGPRRRVRERKRGGILWPASKCGQNSLHERPDC